MNDEFRRRKERVMQLTSAIEGLEFVEPDGAFYVFPSVSFYLGRSDGAQLINNADDLCMYLLNTAHVSTVTGSAFGDARCIRISFANSMANIEKGFERIAAALRKLH
jgi:aspartate aminotransferase